MKTPEMLNRLAGEYPLIEMMLHHGIPVTRDSYLRFNFPDGVPDPLPAEEEAELPEPLQLNPAASARLGPAYQTVAEREAELMAEILQNHPGLTREEAQELLDSFF
jgi:hypothetical protein